MLLAQNRKLQYYFLLSSTINLTNGEITFTSSDTRTDNTNTIREYKSVKYTLDNDSVDNAIKEFKERRE